MAKVFETPRYDLQTLLRVRAHLDIYYQTVPKTTARIRFGDGRESRMDAGYVNRIMGWLNLQVGIVAERRFGKDMSEKLKYQKCVFLEGYKTRRNQNMTRARSFGAIFHNICTMYPKLTVWTDYTAVVKILHTMHVRNDFCKLSSDIVNILPTAEQLGMTTAQMGLMCCNLGMEVDNVLNMQFKPYTQYPDILKKWKGIYYCMEKLKLSGADKNLVDGNKMPESYCTMDRVAKFSIKHYRVANCLKFSRAYRVCGFWILEYRENNEVFILDHSSMDQLVKCIGSIKGILEYWLNYSLIGDPTIDNPVIRSDNFSAAVDCLDWVMTKLKEHEWTDFLAKDMKMGQAILLTTFHEHNERLDLENIVREQVQRDSQKEYLPMEEHWQDFLKRLRILDRQRFDMSNFFHILPAPDINLQFLTECASVTMASAHVADPDQWKAFMRYVKAYDFCKVIVAEGSIPAHKKEDGYEFTNSTWAQRCVRGQFSLPPEEEWGKAWVYHHFAWADGTNYWFYSAADVTHVNSNIKEWETLQAVSNIKREHFNELL